MFDTAQNELANLREQLAAQQQNIELREQLALPDLALDSIPTHFAAGKIAPAGSVVVYCNRAVSDNLSQEREELLGKSGKFVGPACTPERYAEAYAAIESRGANAA